MKQPPNDSSVNSSPERVSSLLSRRIHIYRSDSDIQEMRYHGLFLVFLMLLLKNWRPCLKRCFPSLIRRDVLHLITRVDQKE